MNVPDPRPRIVVLIQQPLSPRDFRRFGIAAMRTRGYTVNVLDVADLAFPMLPNRRDHYKDFSGFDLSVIRTLAELCAATDTIAAARLTVCYVGSGHVPARVWPIFKLISSAPTPYLMTAPSTPVFSGAATATRSTADRIFNRGGPLNIADSVLARMPLRLLGVRPPDFIVVPALKSDLNRPLFNGRSKHIPAHVMDYDLYLEELARPKEPQNIAVFIDQNIGFHPDAESMGIRRFTPEYFYACLRRFFDAIETDLKLEVVIAAHPRADYSETPGLFGNRRIVHGQTTSLIRNGKLAIASYSTAILQAIAFRTPVLFYASRELTAYLRFAAAIEAQARSLGCSPVMIDDGTVADIAAHIHEPGQVPPSFFQDWIRHPDAPEKPYWDIVLDSLVEAGVLPAPDSRGRLLPASVATRVAS